MAPYGTDDITPGGSPGEHPGGSAGDAGGARRRATRYVVPVAVVGVAAATIGLVPALADSGDPHLPKISAQKLLEKIAASDVDQLSGTVKITTDLGLPDLGGLESGLLSGASPQGGGSTADPSSKLTELASGTHTLRVAVDGPDRHKLSIVEKAAEYSVIHNGDEVWAYDSASNQAYHAEEPGGAKDGKSGKNGGKHHRAGSDDTSVTPKDLAEQVLKAADGTTSVTVDGTARVAGRDAYKLLVKPEKSGSTVGAISIAVDARTGLPLKFTLTPSSGGAAVVDAGFTKVSFDRPAASTFDFTPPKGTKVTEEDDAAKQESRRAPGGAMGGALPGLGALTSTQGARTIGEGWTAIAEFGGDESMPSDSSHGSDSADDSTVSGLLGSFGDKVTGKFGSGTVFSTRLVNALITDDGRVYAGAVTKDALVKAADAAK
ncbi:MULTISPECIES: LolA family protein [unclassified Streptomyces]|uniref:LolA family protein n=1 Tax=unclassified Streptomyces TaxID=2593676 RepID=UPI0004BFE40B|nr:MULTISPECIES: outer membrane lipoprotein carrier protein LolA [unclassified Streptomyces]